MHVITKDGEDTSFLPLEVNTTVELTNIIRIEEQTSIFSLIFLISFEWHDSRIAFNFIKKNANEVDKDVGLIWTPTASFRILNDPSTSIEVNKEVHVVRQGRPQIVGGWDSIRQNESYAGRENPLQMTSEYQGDFVCTFPEIARYPFDSQRCSLDILVAGNLHLTPRFLDNGPATVGLYNVNGWTMQYIAVSEEKQCLKLTVNLGRNLASIILVTYLPTILMNLINQVTNYCDNYELVITVNITCMMVLASVYISVASSLPPTAAIKYIEIWLVFNLAYPAMVIIVNIIMQVLKY
jgi:hypothetical protein